MLSLIMSVITCGTLIKHRGKTMKFKRPKLNKKSTQRWKNITYASFLLFMGQHVIATAETTALKDNAVIINSNFSNFDGVNLLIDIPKYPFLGEYRFLKVFDTSGHVLFLGKVSALQAFTLPLHVQKTTHDLSIELFTEHPLDQTVVLSNAVFTEKWL